MFTVIFSFLAIVWANDHISSPWTEAKLLIASCIKSDAAKSDAAKSDAAKSDAAKSDAAKSDAAKSDARREGCPPEKLELAKAVLAEAPAVREFWKGMFERVVGTTLLPIATALLGYLFGAQGRSNAAGTPGKGQNAS
jgi:hypothetical protein